MNKIFGIDIGGTKCVIAQIQEDGVILKRERIATHSSEQGEYILDRIIEVIRAMDVPVQNTLGIGVGSAGQISRDGRVLSATDTFQNWQGLNIQEYLENKLALPVKVINDVQAMALGEMTFGAAKGAKDMICLALGTGVGGGIINEGQLYRGHLGAAGEFGHFILIPDGLPCPCGSRGCVEAYLSGKALERAYAKKANTELSGTEIFSLSELGDVTAQKVVKEYLHYLIVTIKSLTAIFNPEMLVIGGRVSQSLVGFSTKLTTEVREEVMAVNKGIEVKISELESDAMVLGAASQFMK